MQTKSKFGRAFTLPPSDEDSGINKGIAQDADTRELTDEEFRRLVGQRQ